MYWEVTEEQIKREREAARLLRRSRWWANICSQAVCRYCQKKLTLQTATMDHIVPLAEGGRSVKGNIAPACKDCNVKKGGRNAVAWHFDQSMNLIAEPK